MTEHAYALDNRHEVAAEHHRALAELLDPHTRARIAALPQWPRMATALEVGAGAGTMAHWLADQLHQVTAADRDTSLLTGGRDNLAVREVDLTDHGRLVSQLGSGYDLVLARMTLQHLPNREQLVPALVDLLTPGGVLLVEDWHVREPGQQWIAHAPSAADRELVIAHRRATASVFDHAGADRDWARRCWQVMLRSGLDQLDTRYHGAFWRGGGPGMALMRATAAQLRPGLLAAGMSPRQLQRFAELSADPAMVIEGHPLYSTSGVRPH